MGPAASATSIAALNASRTSRTSSASRVADRRALNRTIAQRRQNLVGNNQSSTIGGEELGGGLADAGTCAGYKDRFID
jgi:hypothetical protein